MNPTELVGAAREISEIPDRTLGASRYLAGVILLRQALESALDAYWLRAQPGLDDAVGRVQLVCLPEYLGDEHAAREITYCWNRLSNAAHHDAYELPPSRDEFEYFVVVTERAVARLGAAV